MVLKTRRESRIDVAMRELANELIERERLWEKVPPVTVVEVMRHWEKGSKGYLGRIAWSVQQKLNRKTLTRKTLGTRLRVVRR